MAIHASITRRSILRALPATAFALAAPAALGAPQFTQKQLPGPSPLPGLIAAHRAALAAYDASCDASHAAWAAAGFEEERVLLLVTKRDGVHHYAYTDAEIDAHLNARMPDWLSEINGRDMAAGRAALAGKLKGQLAAIRADNARRHLAHGLPAIEAHHDACIASEIGARIALYAYRPRDVGEAELKARYMAESEPFAEGWLEADKDELRALLALLARPEGVA